MENWPKRIKFYLYEDHHYGEWLEEYLMSETDLPNKWVEKNWRKLEGIIYEVTLEVDVYEDGKTEIVSVKLTDPS